MSVYAIGVDLAEVERMRVMIDRYGERFLQRVFTAQEIEYCRRKKASAAESFAARFAAKEAVFKAAGTGLTIGMRWHDVEVLNNSHGRP
ncbi:MAG: holo-ACP synthase, partial [Calditrichaeota bacterium]|nr:holo-ACP synthase [Calditrichota bacterium]